MLTLLAVKRCGGKCRFKRKYLPDDVSEPVVGNNFPHTKYKLVFVGINRISGKKLIARTGFHNCRSIPLIIIQ